MKEFVTVFTDGSSRGNPGPGGWGAIVSYEGRITELGGKESETTNNRMELTAVLSSLLFIEERSIVGDIVFYIDSQYVISGITIWMYSWEKNGWRTQTKDQVLNQDIWKQLLPLVFRLKQKRKIHFNKVDGHVGVIGNERVDTIATSFADGGITMLFLGTKINYEKLLSGKLSDLSPTMAKVKTKKKSSATAYSYVSYVNGVIYTDADWSTCEARVKGKKNVKFKKVFSREEEAKVIKEFTA